MYANSQQNDRETSGYPNKNRENGYRSPYDPERDWNGYRGRDEREREYISSNSYSRQKRDWSDNRDYRPVADRSPSPKRRKMREEAVESPFKQRYDSPRYSYRSRSRSPSPTAEKERFPREYYRDRDYSYSRDKDYPRGSSYYDVYPRRRWDNRNSYHRSHYQSFHDYDDYRDSRRDYERDYDRDYNDRYREGRYDNRYRNDFDYDRHRDRDSKDRDEFRDRRSRSRSRERSPFEDDRKYISSSSTSSSVVSSAPTTTSSTSSTSTSSTNTSASTTSSSSSKFKDDYYSPRREAEEYDQLLGKSNSNISSQVAPSNQETTPPMDKQESDSKEQPAPLISPQQDSPTEGGNTPQLTTPTPKRRLGWGQGLVAFEKKTTTSDDKEQESNGPATPPKIDIETYLQAHQAQTDVKETVKPPPLEPVKVERVASPTPMEAESTEKQSVQAPAPVQPPVPETPKISKEEALGIIERLDADINKTEAQIAQLKKPKSQHKHKHLLYQNLAQDIYDENREKIEQAREEIEKLLPSSMKNLTQPLYKSPSEVPGINENVVTNIVMKNKIAKAIKQRKSELKVKQEKIKEKYHKLYDSWKKKVQKMEQKRQKQSPIQSKKSNHAHTIIQDIEETKRPILRSGPGGVRPATPRGRMFPSGDAARSEAEFEQIMLSLREEDDRDPDRKYLKTLAKIPPMIPMDEKMPRFVDRVGLIPDPMAIERERKLINPWTEEEKQIFMKKFMYYGKIFSRISCHLENKSTADVVWYYYANKKTLDLKKILRDQQNKRRSWGGRKGYSSPAVPTNAPGLPRELANLGVTSTYWGDRRKPNLLTNPEEEIDVPWNETEREMFSEAYEKYASDFKGIATYLGTKTSVQCKFYYQNYFKNKRTAPEPIEDPKKSFKIARTQSREDTGKDIIASSSKDDSDDESSSDVESPEEASISRKGARIANTWKPEEKESFLKYFRQYGKNWKKLASMIPSKNANQIKYYFQTNCQKLNLDKIEPEVKEEVVHKKRGRKPNAEKQRILAEKRAAEEAAKVAKAASLQMPTSSKIERVSSSEENVNIDQEDSPGDSTSSVNLRTDESIQLEGDEEDKLNKLREEEDIIQDFMPSPTIPKSFSSEDSLDIIEQEDETSEEKSEQLEISNQPSSAQVESETPSSKFLEESPRKDIQMEVEQPQISLENTNLPSSEKTEIISNSIIENQVISENFVSEQLIIQTFIQNETQTILETQITTTELMTQNFVENSFIAQPSEPIIEELPVSERILELSSLPIITEPTESEIVSDIPVETPVEPLQEDPVSIVTQVQPTEKQSPMEENSPVSYSMEGDLEKLETMQLESNIPMELVNEVSSEVPVSFSTEEAAPMPVDSALIPVDSVAPTSVPSISTMEGISDFISDAPVETTCSTQATDSTTAPPSGSDGTVLG